MQSSEPKGIPHELMTIITLFILENQTADQRVGWYQLMTSNKKIHSIWWTLNIKKFSTACIIAT